MDFRGFRFTEEQVDSLLVQCDELAGLLSVWGKRSEEIRHSVHDLSLLVGVELRPSLAPAPSPAVAKSSPISAGWSSPSSGAARSPGVGEDCGDDLGDVDFFIPAKKIDFASRLGLNGSSGSRSGEDRDPGLADEKGSNSSDSSSLHIDVDETWAQRLNDLGGDDAGVFDDPIIRTPSAFAVFGFRTGPHLLERIEEGSQEDVETSSDCQSSGSSEGPASGRSSRDSSLERAWASVPEAGFAAPAAPQEQPLATEAQRGRQSPRPGGDREKKENKKKKEPRKEARAASYEAKAFGGGISKVHGRWRRGGVSFHSVELWHTASGELVAGEVGYTCGSIYSSCTGFTRKDKFPGAGSVQLAALGRWLQRCGFAIWDLGMEMDYKTDLGGKLVQRSEWATKVRTLRDAEARLLQPNDGEADAHQLIAGGAPALAL